MQAVPQVEDIETGALSDNAQVPSDGAVAPQRPAYRQCGPIGAWCTTALALIVGFYILGPWKGDAHRASAECIACYDVCDRTCANCYCLSVTPGVRDAMLNGSLNETNFPYELSPLHADTSVNECGESQNIPCGL